jgi:hypothetical protein
MRMDMSIDDQIDGGIYAEGLRDGHKKARCNMGSIHPWLFGLAAKPDHLHEVRTLPTFEKVYPVHRFKTEVDPTKKQCRCGTVTDWVCEGCEELYCEQCMGYYSNPNGPIDRNWCNSCMESFKNCAHDD